jgi:hypothetical protein
LLTKYTSDHLSARSICECNLTGRVGYVWRPSKASKPYIGIFAALFDSGSSKTSLSGGRSEEISQICAVWGKAVAVSH